jgi:hypothetical protein
MYENDAADGDVTITVEAKETARPGAAVLSLRPSYAANAETRTEYTITITQQDKETALKNNGTFGFEPVGGDVDYQAVIDSQGFTLVSKYSTSTKKIMAKIRETGTFTVRENRKSFGDLSAKDAKTRETIEKLASRGVINGRSEKTFAPDDAISRVELTALIMRALSRIDKTAPAVFADVTTADWFYHEANSAYQYGIVNGTSDDKFSPNSTIQKDQIVAIAARTLQNENPRYKPIGAEEREKYLKDIADRGSLADWSLGDIAFAFKMRLVAQAKDGRFNPTEKMTRCDAAMILGNLFDIIW